MFYLTNAFTLSRERTKQQIHTISRVKGRVIANISSLIKDNGRLYESSEHISKVETQVGQAFLYLVNGHLY